VVGVVYSSVQCSVLEEVGVFDVVRVIYVRGGGKYTHLEGCSHLGTRRDATVH
jgi:hypothetical protein